MKLAVALVALVALAASAPQPRKIFHEHFQDFIDLIEEEAGEELFQIMVQYEENEEFMAAVNYMRTANFKNLVYEMEHLPEFQAVQEYLDTHNVDVSYFIDLFDTLLDQSDKRKARQSISGKDFSSFVNDSIAAFPKDKLAALFDQKVAEDDDFKAAMDGLQSAEFYDLLDDLLENPTFLAEVEALAENGIDMRVLVNQLFAIFGQN